MNMEQSGQQEDSNYNLYAEFDTAMHENGAGHDGDEMVTADPPASDLLGGGSGGGWDHDPRLTFNDSTTPYSHVDTNTTSGEHEQSAMSMEDYYEPMHFEHEFPDSHHPDFHHESATDFPDFNVMGDDHPAEPENTSSFVTQPYMPMYPDITSETTNFESQPAVSTPELSPTTSMQSHAESAPPSTTGPSTSTSKPATSTQQRQQPFNFTPQQKQFLLERFDAGLHYPTKTEKEDLATQISVPVEMVVRWFERTRKEKKITRSRKAPEAKTIEIPQYLPVQPRPSPSDQPIISNPNVFQQQFQQQFPNTYPYNLSPHFFNQGNLPGTMPTHEPMTVNPSAGLYAPIPSLAQSVQPAFQNVVSQTSGNGVQAAARTHSPFAVEVQVAPINREGVYVDDKRNVKKARIDHQPPTVAIAPKPAPPPRKPMTFEDEVDSILRPSEWREDANQAAVDLYDIMGDAEEDNQRKLFLLRGIRNGATELALKTMSHEDHRKILAKLRNWFTAGIKVEDTEVLSHILEIIRKMNIDGRTMAGIKLGKPLILLMKKNHPTLQGQLALLQKTAYEAYGLEKNSGSKPLKAESPIPSAGPSTTGPPSAIAAAATKTATAASRLPASAAQTSSNIASKLKPSKGQSGSSFFGKLAQVPVIPKAPVSSKPIPVKRSITPTRSMGVTVARTDKWASAAAPPPKPATSLPPKPAPSSKFSVLEYINRDDSADKEAKAEASDSSKASRSRKRKHVSWAEGDNLERVKMIENITIKYGEDLFWNPPQEFGNARDMDIGEGRAFGSDTVEYDVEEEIEWYEPKFFSFSELKADEENRGVKRAGVKVAESKEAEAQKIREAGVLLVSYLNEADIPDSPSEPFLEELVTSQQAVPPPKIIPLPQELRAQNRIPVMPAKQPVAGIANPNVTAILSSLLGGSAPTPYQQAAPVQNPDLASILQSLGGQPAAAPPPAQPAIPQNIDLTSLLSQLQPTAPAAPPVQHPRWTSPPPSSRRDKPRPTATSTKSAPNPKSQIRASRAQDVRESVRNSDADQNQYRLLCQFYERGECTIGENCRFVHPRDMRLYEK